MLEQISNFVEGIRIQQATRSPVPTAMVTTNNAAMVAQMPQQQPAEDNFVKKGQQARELAQDLLVEAEQFKANLQKPKGKTNEIEWHKGLDDEFFHITCHIDPDFTEQIEKGKFIELEKLLPKDKVSGRLTEETKMELVNKNGLSYFVPANDKEKIGNVRKWEQVFRVYATIYSQANPHRSPEIWQYIHVINTAAAAYTWENVASYDFTFCQLMARYPHRSWAQTYSQYWNLCMRDLIHKHSSPNGGGSNGKSGYKKKSKDNYCWTYNKNRCKKGHSCEFEPQMSVL